jgi:hypothetical protein
MAWVSGAKWAIYSMVATKKTRLNSSTGQFCDIGITMEERVRQSQDVAWRRDVQSFPAVAISSM